MPCQYVFSWQSDDRRGHVPGIVIILSQPRTGKEDSAPAAKTKRQQHVFKHCGMERHEDVLGEMLNSTGHHAPLPIQTSGCNSRPKINQRVAEMCRNHNTCQQEGARHASHIRRKAWKVTTNHGMWLQHAVGLWTHDQDRRTFSWSIHRKA